MRKLFKKAMHLPVVPQHVGIIMDGNGRWAKKRGLPRSVGHRKGAAVFKTITRHCRDRGVRFLTVYAFSTENWKRSPEEVDGIMELLREYLRDVENYTRDNIRVRFIGDRSVLDEDIVRLMENTEKTSENYTAMTLNIAVNYGGLPEITRAARRCAERTASGELCPEQITEQLLEQELYTAGQPSADLIIRTGGEWRLSNFLTWQSAYSELYFCDVLWPDFTPRHLDQALSAFAGRQRRYGGA